MGEYDKSSKWLIQHDGDSILRLAGIRDVESWCPLQAEVVQPGQLPDGLLEVKLTGEPDPDLFVLEIGTYPESRLLNQVVRDMTLVFLDRRILPEVVVLLLYPRRPVAVLDFIDLTSRRGLTRWTASWRVVELWKIPAKNLLAIHDPGLMPWLPLTKFTGPPAPLFKKCRETIDQRAKPDEHENLLAVTQVLAKLRYNDPQLLNILGGRKVMIESPLIQELLAERMHSAILMFLEGRFGSVPPSLTGAVQAIADEQKLNELAKLAARCRDLKEFRKALRATNSKHNP